VLADIELSSGLRISTRLQRLTLARAIYNLLALDPTAAPDQLSFWDRFSSGNSLSSQTLDSPFTTIYPIGSANNPITSPAMTTAQAAPQSASMTSLLATPSNSVVLLDTPLSVQVPLGSRPPVITPNRLEFPGALPSSQANTLPSSSSVCSQQPQRTRSVSAEYTGLDQVVTQAPRSDESQQELAMILPCGTRIYKERAPIAQTLDWPTLYSFDSEAWSKFIVKYRRVNASALPINSIPIVRRLDPLIHKEVCQKFELDHAHYFAYPNGLMEQKFFNHFGPSCASTARDRFVDKHFKFDDTCQHQNTFASVVYRFFQEKLQMLQDFLHVETTKWVPTDEFTHNMVIDATIKCFPLNPTSSNNETIAQMIRDHRGKTLQQIQSLVQAHFTAIDANVDRNQGSYHVHPTRAAKDKSDKRNRDDRTWTSRDGGNYSGRRGTSHDGSASHFNTFERTRPASDTHERGVCGSRKHTCSAATCLLWGEAEAKPAGYAWGAEEPSVSIPKDRYLQLKEAKPQVALTYLRSPPAATRGTGIAHGHVNRPPSTRTFRGRGRGASPYRGRGGAERNVNHSQYAFQSMHSRDTTVDQTATPPISPTMAPPAETDAPTEPQFGSFHAVARIERETAGKSPRCTKTLMDSGADSMNIIRSSIIDDFKDTRAAIRVLGRRINCITLTNNGKPIGRSTEEVRITFTLDTLPTETSSTYTEWFFMFDDLAYDMILGSTFNRTQGFTTYHKSLVEWSGVECPRAGARF
jgi:hypothetical protein